MTDELDRLKTALGDRYILSRELGEGGMATVYLAEDQKHQREVAVKVLRPQIAATLGAERFVREIEIAAKLSHPHILPLFDSGSSDGVLYYVMPYVEGESLRDRLGRDGKLSVDEAIRFTGHVASALSYAHERGVVHRDIKPENIMLAGDQAIVADFGIARAVEAAGDQRLTGTGLAIGTPAYMSPEQWLGSGEIDQRTDVYSLGCVLYEVISGQAPFEGRTPQALLAKHAAEAAPLLRTTDPSVPVFVEQVAERAMAKDPADRFATASAMAEALTTGTVVAQGSQWPRSAFIAVAAVAIAALAWTLATALGDRGVERLAVLPLISLNDTPEQEYLVEGVHEALISEIGQLGVSVIARATMAQYRNTSLSIREIAAELGVDAVLEGSLLRSGDDLEIVARMYDGESEEELWSQRYEGDLPNVVALYRGITRSIAEEIRITLSPEAESRLSQAPPVRPEVYEAYLRGMYLLNQSTPEGFEEALTYFDDAVRQAPSDALAYAGLALGYVTVAHGPAPPPNAWQTARAAAERAVRLDSTLAEAWAALADVKMYYEWDWEGAERAFRKANELNPSLAMNHYHYAWFHILFGRAEEAIAEHERARELDPLTPLHSVWIPGMYWWLGRHEEALASARATVAEYPDHATALFCLGVAAGELGEHAEAIEALERAVAISDRWNWALGRAYHRAGRTDEALRILGELEAEPPSPWGAVALADLHTALGNTDEAFRWLAYEPAHAWLPWSRNNPNLAPLRDDPRFDELLERLKLPPPQD